MTDNVGDGKAVVYRHTLHMELGQTYVKYSEDINPEAVHGRRGANYDSSYHVTVTPFVPALTDEDVRRIAVAAHGAVAAWFAAGGKGNSIDQVESALREAFGMGERG